MTNIRTLHAGPCRVVIAGSEVESALPEQVERAVADIWQVERAARPSLHNGTLMSAINTSGGVVSVNITEYRRFLAQRRHPELRQQLRVTPVAVSGLVVTRDGGWLFGRRGTQVTQYPGYLESVPSGTLDERALAGRPAAIGTELDPVVCLLAELTEEAGIDESSVADVQPLGVFLDVEENTVDIGYLLRLRVSVRDLASALGRGSSPLEYEELQAFSETEVDHLIAQASVVPTSKALWQVRPPSSAI